MRDGRVVDFAPNRDNPYSKGAFCIKGIRGAPGITYGPNRLLHPMRRTGARGEGKWARVSWDEALEEMAERLAQVRQKYGPEAIVGATSGAYFSRSVILALTLRSIGSPNWMINQDLCGGCRAVSARTMGLNITRGEDIDNTRCALIVGRNPSIADPVEWAALKAAKKRGARMIVIDPKRTQAAQMADLWLAPRVGTDAALALAMTHVLIAEDLYDKAFVARWCHGFDAAGRARRAVSAGGRGRASPACPPSRSSPRRACMPTGPPPSSAATASTPSAPACRRSAPTTASSPSAATSTAPAATCACARRKGFAQLHAICCTCRSSASTPRPRQRTIGADRFPLWAGPKGWQTACHNPSVIEAMLTGRPYPVRALYASGVNILVTYPNTRRTIEALRSLDFVAVAAHAMTPTAEHRRHRAAQDDDAGGGGGLVHALRPDRALHARRRAAAGRGALARSTSPLPLLDKMAQRQALARQPAALALAARVQHLSAGRLRHPHRGPGADRLSPAERRAARPRAAVRDADRQDRAVLHRHGRSSGSTRCRPTTPPSRERLPEDTAKRYPARSSSPATARRATTTRASAISPGRSRSRPIRGSPCTPTPRAPWAWRTTA